MVLARAKYHAIRDELRDLIAGMEVGEGLPPERRLASEFGVARMTLRRAVDELVREGLVIRRQGAGMFVAEPKIAQPLSMTSFSEDMRRRGFVPGSRTLSLEDVHAGPRLGRRLEVSPDTRVLRVVRLRLADSAPIAIEVLHVASSLVPGLAPADLDDHSFYELLADRYAVHVDHGVQTVEPTVTNEEESQVLGVPLHSPAFLFERTTRTRGGTVIEFVRSVYRGDRYRLTTELVAPPPAVAGHRLTGPA